MAEPVPLNVLLSHALLDFTREYDQAGSDAGETPNIVIWSDLLRLIGDGVDERDLTALARVSRRVVICCVKRAVRQGWISHPPVALTGEGRRVTEAWGRLFDVTESRWRSRFGHDRVDALHAALERFVAGLELELPHYLTPYGPSDSSMIGGRAVAAKPGPPRIPAHGKDWAPVLREPGADTTSNLGLCALLSQALTAFAIDYEANRRGPLVVASYIGGLDADRPTPLENVPLVLDVKGNGKTGLERHGIVTVKKDGARLTPIGVAIRDSYQPLMAGVEAEWSERYGRDSVANLRTALEALEPDLPSDLKPHPIINFSPKPGFEELTDQLAEPTFISTRSG